MFKNGKKEINQQNCDLLLKKLGELDKEMGNGNKVIIRLIENMRMSKFY